MAIVKISDGMHKNLRAVSNALSRSVHAQGEHWMRLGMLAEMHPELDHNQLSLMLVRIEKAGGWDMNILASLGSRLKTVVRP